MKYLIAILLALVVCCAEPTYLSPHTDAELEEIRKVSEFLHLAGPDEKLSPEQNDYRYHAFWLVEEEWGLEHWEAFDRIVYKESSWNPRAKNPTSGACGLPQALPCSKLGTDVPEEQLEWMVEYIKDRYNTPRKALAYHNIHNWY